jgi:hypothetical protein
VLYERADQCRLADSWRSCDSDPIGAAGVGIDIAYQFLGLVSPALDQAESPSKRTFVAGANACCKLCWCPGTSGHER